MWIFTLSALAFALPTPETLAARALALASGAGLHPVATQPLRVGVIPEGMPYYSHRRAVERGGPVCEVAVFGMPYTVEPWAVLAGDSLEVRWETRDLTAPAALFAGVPPEDDPFAEPRYTAHAAEEGWEPRREHHLRLPLSGLLEPTLDADGVRQRGYGTLHWRVAAAIAGVPRYADGRLAFQWKDDVFSQAPGIALGPFVARPSLNRWVIWWETDVPTSGVVAVGDDLYPSLTPARRHEVDVGALPQGGEIAYQVSVSDGGGWSVSAPRTLSVPAAAAPVRLAILSDSRGATGPGLASVDGVAYGAVRGLLNAAAQENIDAIVFPGDLIDGYVTHPDDYTRQLRTWLRAAEGAGGRVPIFATMGNHEALLQMWSDGATLDRSGADSGEARFAALMVNPENGPAPIAGAPPYSETAYSFEVGAVHVAVLNTNYGRASHFSDPSDPRIPPWGNREGILRSEQFTWLDADLRDARARGMRHLVVTGHEEAFPTGPHARDGMWWSRDIPEVNAARERLWRLLAQYDVIAYVAGDDHHYARAQIGAELVGGVDGPVWSITTGGGGAPWYAVKPPDEYAQFVVAGSPQPHYTLWTFSDETVELRAVSASGTELDRAVLWAREPSGGGTRKQR